MIELMKTILQKKLEQPIISQPYLVNGSIILRVLAANPSETEAKEAVIRTPLPQEIRPEHVLDADGLEVEYDPQLGMYVVHGTVLLAPKASIVKSVLLEDIWTIPAQRFTVLRQETDELMAKLAGSEFDERGGLLASAITRRLEDIEQRQGEPFSVSPFQATECLAKGARAASSQLCTTFPCEISVISTSTGP